MEASNFGYGDADSHCHLFQIFVVGGDCAKSWKSWPTAEAAGAGSGPSCEIRSSVAAMEEVFADH